MSHTSSAGLFLLQTIFSLITLVALLRFLFQLMRVDFYNQISQTVSRISDPLLRPLRRLIPATRRIDGASLTLLLAMQMLSIATLYGIDINPLGLLMVAMAEILSLTATVFTWSIIVLVIMSWIQPQTRHPAISLLHQLTAPIMQPLQRALPATGSGIDLSPILALFAIKLVEFMLVAPLRDLAAIFIR
ncbi:MAG: YggT family protein [Gammaproteobacteria bacterium]|nr:YggT family protein [Gammaproteobacteria bacterium]